MNSKTSVVLTVDVEASFYRDIPLSFPTRVYGEIEGQFYGVPRIMDICDKYGVKATFFVNVYEYKIYGEEKLKELCAYISNRGHDVQLHTHPMCAYDRKRGYMTDYSLEEQTEIIADGKSLLQKWIGKSPIAHRAGDFAADKNTLEALRRNDIMIDSSLALGWPLCKLNDSFSTKNQIVTIDGILEVPITVFYQFKIGRYRSLRQVDIDADSCLELKYVLNKACKSGMKVAIVLLHSFSFLKWDKYKVRHRPDYADMKRFDLLLKYITGNEQLEVITMEGLAQRYLSNPEVISGAGEIPKTGWFITLHRALLGVHKSWKNLAFVLINVGIIALMICLILVSIWVLRS